MFRRDHENKDDEVYYDDAYEEQPPEMFSNDNISNASPKTLRFAESVRRPN